MIGPRTTRLPHARRRALAAAALAIGALIFGIGASPAVASTAVAAASSPDVVTVSPALAGNPVALEAATTSIGDSLAMAGQVLGDIRPMTLVGFKPGNIISDAAFFNRGAMTEAQIQTFLNSKVPSCQSGYVCLRNFKQTTAVRAASPLCAAYAPAANETAARIIFKVAQACGINPQVILVTLQKEQGLVTHTWPSEFRYRIAMGQGCPDTAACDTAYYGFFNQVYGAAAQFKRYANPPGTSKYFTWYAPGKTWNVGFHPNAACGSTPVRIENQATANLYYYTPYQPNAAALAAGYAAANNACSSYGNRNFYNYFTDWFGSTQTPTGPCTEPTAVATATGMLYVNADAVNARKAPNADCATGVSVLAKGVAVLRTGTYQEWVRVDAHGVAAWVHRDYLSELTTLPAPKVDLDDTKHVATIDAAGTLRAYPFSGNGRWGAAVTVLSGQKYATLVAAGDLDGDGHRDLIAIDAAKKAWLLRGDGTSYSAPVALAVDWATARLITSAGDFDGDGIPDVFVLNTSGQLHYWSGDGKGGFRAPVAVGKGWGGFNAIVGGVDFSGDGKPDLVARHTNGTLYLYRGDGAGGWAASGTTPGTWGDFTALFTPGDFSGDGRADLIARDSSGRLQLYRGTGAGFVFMATVGTGWNGMTSIVGPGLKVTTGTPPTTPAPSPARPGAGDINGDGHPDVVGVSGKNLVLYRGSGKGGWLGSTVLDAAWPAGARLVTMGDFNGDGLPDIGRITSSGAFQLLAGASGGTLKPAVTIGSGWAGFTSVVGGIDFDGDGAVDVIARTSAGKLVLYRGNGSGGWLPGTTTIGSGWNSFNVILNAGDFDGDGAADVIVRRADNGALWMYPTTGKGGWGKARQIGSGWGGFNALLVPGNFDGAGGIDVIARTAGGALQLYRGNGTGGWSGSVQIGKGWNGFSQLG